MHDNVRAGAETVSSACFSAAGLAQCPQVWAQVLLELSITNKLSRGFERPKDAAWHRDCRSQGSASSPPLLLSVKSRGTRRRQVVMKEVKRILMVVLMAVILSITLSAQMTAFGQKGNNNNRPPKEEQRVKERDKPPPSNSNSNNRNSNGKGHGHD